MKLNGIGMVAVAALGAGALFYLYRKYQQRALTMRTNADLLREPIKVTGGDLRSVPIITPPRVIYIDPVRLQ